MTQALHSPNVPVIDIDPFSDDYVLNPYPFHRQLREAGPVAWMSSIGTWVVSRFAQVRQVLEDPETYCSGAGVGLANFKKEKPWRPPSLLLETDPPQHTRNRAIISRALSPAALRSLREKFEVEANRLVDELVSRGSFDAVRELAEAFPLKVFGDAVGIVPDGRERLLLYADMVFNAMGPQNERVARAMSRVQPVAEWVWESCQRKALDPAGLGMKIFEAADAGTVNEHEAAMIVRSFLSAGIDTTANAIGNAIYCFANNPQQWELLRNDPNLARPAFEEVMRFESPFQALFRTTTRKTQIGDVELDADQKVLLSLGAANRDPQQFPDPDRFDITRPNPGHVGFGAGIHGCVGQMMARMEAELVIKALAARVKSFEITDGAIRRPHNILRGFETLPVRVHT
ncbi:cytochrome P450 [Noviherbaspirillum denitrificans]|uniref:Cytochrome n=1 Tax=Noviherbaspirillum denitrificans TaxID=1968433 RepID=A0A254TGB6_9BURK|nr:cytochrome P450 [Noviherbaspirillum denitrificans]OWW18718.1 cytochrome [Noviherbaspirillum denitrificans]